MIICICGKRGTGKDTIAEIISKKHGFKFLSFSEHALRKELEKRKLEVNRKNLIKVAIELRKKHGKDIFAKKLCEIIEREGKKDFVITGIRYIEEYEYMRKRFKEIYLVCVVCDDMVRYKRAIERGDKEKNMDFEEFMSVEKTETETQIPKLMEIADFVIDNNGSKRELKKNVFNFMCFLESNIEFRITHVVAMICNIEKDEILKRLEWKLNKLADVSISVHTLHVNVEMLISAVESIKIVKSVNFKNMFLNIFLDWNVILQKIFMYVKDSDILFKPVLNTKKVVIDYSAPNIAKPFSVSHLRSTLLGNSIYRILKFVGCKCVSDMHQGDWGTQFGKVITAFKMFGNKRNLEKRGVKYLLELYVKFHKLAEKNKKLEDIAREEFRKLERGDKDNKNLWKMFSKISMDEFDKVYKIFGINFDYKIGESFYIEIANNIVNEMLKSGIAKISNNAVVVDLKEYGMPPLVIQKSDESTLYSTRDLATIKYREIMFKPDEILYIVGSEQKLYFKQVFKVAELLGFDAKKYKHIEFGLLTFEGTKLSTRKGKVIFIEDLIDIVKREEINIVEERGYKIDNKKIEKLAISAIKFAIFTNSRRKDIKFSFKKFLSFKGKSAPYILYTYARARSILRKYLKPLNANFINLEKEREVMVVKHIYRMRNAILNAVKNYDPHYIAEHVFNLCNIFNDFYQNIRVLDEEDNIKRESRLVLVFCASEAIKLAMDLLGIEVMEEI